MAGLCPQAQPDDTGGAPTVVTREQITARVLSVRTTYKAKGPSAIAQLTKAILTFCAVVRWRRIWVGACHATRCSFRPVGRALVPQQAWWLKVDSWGNSGTVLVDTPG